MNIAVVTIVSKNYLPFARVLMRSIERHNPTYRRFVILTDSVGEYFDPAGEPFTIILSRDLPIDQNEWMHFKYSILELNTAVKPYAIEYLAERYGVSHSIYLDPDIRVYWPLDQIIDQMDSSDVLLTPHLLDPIDDGFVPGEIDILRAGAFNLGFIAIRANSNSREFLRWWQKKVSGHCYVDFERGLFTDQRWIDLAPGMFRNVGIVRDPGYNVAYWNLKTRLVERESTGAFTVAGGPLYFFHFSGLDVSSPADLSRHQSRFQLSDLGVVRDLVLEYSQDVLAHGYVEARNWPYEYGRFRNGAPIPDKLRRFVAECPELMSRMPQPFSAEAYGELVNYWNSSVPDPCGNLSCITRLAQVIYDNRPDLQTRAPELFGRDLLWFLDWFVHNVQREYEVDEILVSPLARHRDRLMREKKAGAPEIVLHRRRFGLRRGIGLNIVGYLQAEMGVGEAVRCAARAARCAGVAISLNNFGITTSRQQDTSAGVIDNQFPYDVNLFNINADQTNVLFERLEERHYAGKYNIGYWAWELEEFPESARGAFRHYDEIWVPSSYCQGSVARKSPIPVIRIPHAIEVEFQRPMSRSDLGLPEDKFVFLSFLDVLSVPKRKNIEGVVAAFRKSCVGPHGGHLVLKVNNGKRAPHVVEQLTKDVTATDVTIINETWSRQQVNSLIACCDCLVSLHRSEGFGLTIAEAMYLGKPTIVTAFSGNMDFTHPDTSMLVDYSLIAVGPGAEPYDPNSRWAEPDTDHAALWMERVLRDSALRTRIAQSGQRYIRTHFSPTVVGEMMKARIGRIHRRGLMGKATALVARSVSTIFRQRSRD